MPKTKVSRGLQYKRNESSEEEPLVVPKVIKQYTRKKKVDSKESINNLACIPTIKVGATWSDQSNSVSLVNNQNHVKIIERYPEIMDADIETGNHVKTEERNVSQNGSIEDSPVKIKEEIMERYPDIEIMTADIETENHVKTEERNVSQNGRIEDNCVKIKEEFVNDSTVQNVGNNLELDCTYKKESSHVNKIKETGVSKTNVNIIDMNVHQIGSNNKTNNIKIKTENVPDRVMNDSKPTETVMQAEEINIKIESDDGLQCTKLEQESVSRTDAPQSETMSVEIKQETEENDCDSHNTNDKLDSSCNEKNEKNISIHKPQILQANSNVRAVQSKILITEEIHIKEEVISKPKINSVYVNNKAPVVNEEKQQVLGKELALGNVKLKRIINMPRLLRTYGRKQPETPETALKTCFLVAVHPPVNAKFKNILTPEQLAMIQEKAAKAKVFICDMCGKNFRSKASVSGHMRFVHSVAMKHKCQVCPASFPHHYLLLAHVRYHSGPPLVCDLCSKRFKSKEKYGEHLNTHLRERLFPCPVCLRRYATLSHLHRHAEKHTQEDTFPCGTCKETYRSIIDLSRHSERDHGEKAEFPCYVCNRILSSNADFLTHVKIHDNVIYPCAFCPRRFNDTQKWEEHSNEHIEKIGNGETLLKPYTCKYCKKSFEYQSILKTHLRMHTGERPYECPVCYKKLKTRSHLTEHVNAHNKPFPCQVCDRRFGKKDSLSRHMLLHTGERPHACTGCSLTFVQRSSMLQHRRRFHEPRLKRARKTNKKNVKKTKKN